MNNGSRPDTPVAGAAVERPVVMAERMAAGRLGVFGVFRRRSWRSRRLGCGAASVAVLIILSAYAAGAQRTWQRPSSSAAAGNPSETAAIHLTVSEKQGLEKTQGRRLAQFGYFNGDGDDDDDDDDFGLEGAESGGLQNLRANVGYSQPAGPIQAVQTIEIDSWGGTGPIQAIQTIEIRATAPKKLPLPPPSKPSGYTGFAPVPRSGDDGSVPIAVLDSWQGRIQPPPLPFQSGSAPARTPPVDVPVVPVPPAVPALPVHPAVKPFPPHPGWLRSGDSNESYSDPASYVAAEAADLEGREEAAPIFSSADVTADPKSLGSDFKQPQGGVDLPVSTPFPYSDEQSVTFAVGRATMTAASTSISLVLDRQPLGAALQTSQSPPGADPASRAVRIYVPSLASQPGTVEATSGQGTGSREWEGSLG